MQNKAVHTAPRRPAPGLEPNKKNRLNRHDEFVMRCISRVLATNDTIESRSECLLPSTSSGGFCSHSDDGAADEVRLPRADDVEGGQPPSLRWKTSPGAVLPENAAGPPPRVL